MAAFGVARGLTALYLLVLALAVLALGQAFAVTGKLATLGDDSASYLAWAHYFAEGGADWRELVIAENRFPPVFPLLLAAAGATADIARGQWLVVGCLALALPLVYGWARQAGLARAAALVCVTLLLVLPWTWLRLLGVMSETLFLLLTLAALCWPQRPERRGDALAFGVLAALAALTRSIGVLLLAAWAIPHALAAWQARDLRRLQPVLWAALPLALALAAWYGLRPGGAVDAHLAIFHTRSLDADKLAAAFSGLLRGWQEQFVIFRGVSAVNDGVVGLLGIWCLAGTLWRCRQNCVDGWYVLLSLLLIWVWTAWAAEQTGRLLFPLLPLLLVQGALLLPYTRRWLAPYLSLPLLFGPAAIIALMAGQLLLQRARNPESIFPGWRYAACLDYYIEFNEEQAKLDARRSQTTLYTFEQLRRQLPPSAAVMWVQPHYVRLLSGLRGVPQLAGWDRTTLQKRIAATGTTHVVYSVASKYDRQGQSVNPFRNTELFDVAARIMNVHTPRTIETNVWVVEVDHRLLAQRLQALPQ